MGITFTETQRQVIEKRGCNLLVSAAAGSGKTAVLVERIVEMVCGGENPVDIDRLLVVTFTNAAAAQMRERVSRALNDRLARDPANEHLQRQTTLLYNAQITTIDSFCLFVLRNQFHTIGLDPGFRIAEEGELRLLRADVLAAVIEEAYGKEDPAFLHCMEYFSVGSRDEAVEKEVLKLYDFAMSMPFPEEWLTGRKEDYRLPAAEELGRYQETAALDETEEREGAVCDPLGLPWAALFMEHVRFVLKGCADRLEEALRLCGEPDGPYFYGELLEKERELIERLLRLCGGAEKGDGTGGETADTGSAAGGGTTDAERAAGGGTADAARAAGTDYDGLCGAFAAVVFGRLPSKRDATVQTAKREAAKALRDSVKEAVSDLRTQFFTGSAGQVCRQMESCQAAVSSLVDLTLAFKAAFDEAKREKNILDFDDIEHFALQALLRREGDGYAPTETALAYRSRFHEILIDEYQDSNMVQEYLLSCISGESEGRYNRFMVGDVKQSIYKFRLARPELFLEKQEAYGGAEENTQRIDLHQNFRSRREVIDSVNAVFARIMGKEMGGIVYDEKAALHPGAVYPQREGDFSEDVSNITQLLLFQEEKPAAEAFAKGEPEKQAAFARQAAGPGAASGRQAAEDGKAQAALSVKEQEAYGVAAQIKTLLREFQVTDKETGALRRASYRDMVILLRTLSGWDEVFKRVLEEEGIPVHVTSRTGYFAAAEVQELLHFLRILDNPLQDIPLYGVLHTYLGGFSEEEIALVRAACPKKKYLYDALTACAGGEMTGGVSGNQPDTDRAETGQTAMGQAYTEQAAIEQTDAGQTVIGQAYTEQTAIEQTDAGQTATEQAVNRQDALVGKDLQDKITGFLDKITEYREMSVYLPVHELLQIILRETGYLHYVAARPEGGRRRANVEMLLVKAADYEKTSYFGLYHFLRYMEQLEKYEVDYGEAAMQDENADVVRIMSIHKSKGLEFPVCFVSGLAAGFRKKEGSGILAVDVDAGIGVDYVDPERRVKGKNLRKNAIALKLRRDSLAEELRILYVAMTRAEEKLILTGVVKNPEKTAAALLPLRRRKHTLLSYDVLLGQDSFLSLLLSALSGSRCLDGFYEACGMESAPDAPEYATDMAFAVKLTGWDHVVEKKIEETVLGIEAKKKLLFADFAEAVNENLMTELSRRFSYAYPHGNLRDLYTKTTVSELKMAGMQETDEAAARLFEEKPAVPYLPKFLRADESVSGSMRGSAFHKVMELFDFCELTDEVSANRQTTEALLKEQMARMLQTGRLSEGYYEAVSVPKLVDFLTGRAASRMARAARAGKLFKEQPFVMGIPASRLGSGFPAEETVLIQGIIDVFFEEEDGLVVLDYKTDAVSAAAELVKRYQVQLTYYSEALAQIYGYEAGEGGKTVKERLIYSFKLGEEISL
ncbi:MAG: UvrD-helicase domain-containing protein [Lachnospiraceae bacterium]|nr:UvrD-helicase domain-containing protein [Lachnospiraceae bacterium]